MSNPIVLELFCPQTASSAAAPGAPVNRQVRLQSARLEKETDLSTTPFDSPNGVVALTASNVKAEIADLFAGGKKYKVTIEPVE